jgi:hypothetical protein
MSSISKEERERRQAAVDLYNTPRPHPLSLREVGKLFGVSHMTLLRDLKAGSIPTVGPGRPTALGFAMERFVVHSVNALSGSNHPMSRGQLSALATGVHVAMDAENDGNWNRHGAGESGEGAVKFIAGPTWKRNFLRRNPEVTKRTPKGITVTRAASETARTLDTFFTNLKAALKEVFPGVALKDIDPKRVCNVDETPFGAGYEDKDVEKVFILHDTNDKHAARPTMINSGRDDYFTMELCVSADGEYLDPFYIVKGKRRMSCSWLPKREGGDLDAAIAITESGHVNAGAFQEWLRWFAAKKADLLATGPVVIIYDNHDSHINADTLATAVSLNIHLIGLPSNSTHLLQPIDRLINGPLHKQWRKVKRE